MRKAEILRQTRLALPSRENQRKEAVKKIQKECGVRTQRRDVKDSLEFSPIVFSLFTGAHGGVTIKRL